MLSFLDYETRTTTTVKPGASRGGYLVEFIRKEDDVDDHESASKSLRGLTSSSDDLDGTSMFFGGDF